MHYLTPLRSSLFLLYIGLFFSLLAPLAAAQSENQAGTQAEDKHRVFVFTDINLVGGDPDDRQSLVHLLWYADELEIVGIVPDYWNGQGYEATMEGIDTYVADYNAYQFATKGFPPPAQIRDRVARNEADAIERLAQAVEASDKPLYVLVWGRMVTMRNALFAHPEIASKIRVLTIGTGRKYGPRDEVAGEDCNVVNWNGEGRNEIYDDARFHNMWWLESNWTYNGMFEGNEPEEMFQKLLQYGVMGKQIKAVTKKHEWAQYFRVGDTPTVLYLIDGSHNPDHPEQSSWAGKFNKPFPETRPNYYTDDNGAIAWDYADPCQTWSNLKAMYAYNKSTLGAERPAMYKALLNKLDTLYGK